MSRKTRKVGTISVAVLLMLLITLMLPVSMLATQPDETLSESLALASAAQQQTSIQEEVLAPEEEQQSAPLANTEDLQQDEQEELASVPVASKQELPHLVVPQQQAEEIAEQPVQNQRAFVPLAADGSIVIYCYLVNEQGEMIAADGTPLADQTQKTIIETYNYEHNGQVAIPLNEEIAVEQISNLHEIYQFMPELSEDNPANAVTLTEEAPVKELYFAYVAKRNVTILANLPGSVSYTTQYTEKLSTGDTISISGLLAPTAPLLNLPAGRTLLGWAYTQTKADTQEEIDLEVDAALLLKDEDLTLYAVISPGQTATITVIPFLANGITGEPIDINGNVVTSFEDVVLFEDQAFLHNLYGETDLAIGGSYTVLNSVRPVALKDITIPGLDNPRNGSYYIRPVPDNPIVPFTNKVENLQGDMVMYYPFVFTQYNTFHTNIPGQADVTFDAYTGYTGSRARPVHGDGVSSNSQIYLYNKGGTSVPYAGKVLASTIGPTGNPEGYVQIGWSTDPASTGNNVPGTEGYDPNFVVASHELIAQQPYDMDIYAIWQPKATPQVKVNIVAYLVNSKGQPITTSGALIEFDDVTDPVEFASKIVPLPAEVVQQANNGLSTSTDFRPNIIQNVTAPKTLTNKKVLPLVTYNYVANAFVHGGTKSPTTALIKEDGTIWSTDGTTEMTIYFGYQGPSSITWHTNYPASSGFTNVSNYTVQTAGRAVQTEWSTAKFKSTVPAAVDGYIFAGWSTSPDDTVAYYPNKGDTTNYGYRRIAIGDGAMDLYAIWVPASQTGTIRYIPILGNTIASAVDKDGQTMLMGNFEPDHIKLGDPIREDTQMPLGHQYYPYDLPDTYTADDGSVYSRVKYTVSNNNMVLYTTDGTRIEQTVTDDNALFNVNPIALPAQPDGLVMDVYVLYNIQKTATIYANYPADAAISESAQTVDVISVGVGSIGYVRWLNQTLEGYKFLGFSEQENDPANLFGLGNSFLMPNRDITLYAQWQKISPNPERGTIMVVPYLVDDDGFALDADGQIVASYVKAQKIKTFQHHDGGTYELALDATYYPYAHNFNGETGGRYLYVPTSVENSAGDNGGETCPGWHLHTNNKDPIVYYGYVFREQTYTITYDTNLPADISDTPGRLYCRKQYFCRGRRSFR
ncbi:InlB B-repeat-containing protein [Ruminococcaceae bacterium OttesenSCG-928-A16]|nr:InlB B-repeat-containing protein [Ruminococcaceae bacterium OttesenSCG-928-A16]